MADEETRRILNEEMRHRLEIQRSAAERVEAKAAIVLGFAATAMQFVISRNQSSDFETVSIAAWALAIAASLVVISVRASGELDPRSFVEDLWNADAPFAHSKLTRTRLHEFEHNGGRLTIRVIAWQVAGLFVAVAGILSALHLMNGEAPP